MGRTGLVVRGWAPQVAVLRHAAVGAFLTHCGWNSVLEAAVAGVPMLTWPLVFEQFIEQLVFDGKRSTRDEKETVPAVARAISQFMEKGGGVEAARAETRKVAGITKAAVAEGGSSWKDLNSMIDEIKEVNKNKRKRRGGRGWCSSPDNGAGLHFYQHCRREGGKGEKNRRWRTGGEE